MAEDEDYKFDEFNDGADAEAQDHHISKMKDFIKKYATDLQTLTNALDESLNNVWDATVDPIGLSFAPYEQTNVVQLIHTDNKVFNKIMMIFVSLCSEMTFLKETISSKFYDPLKLFGTIGNETTELKEGDGQLFFGRLFTLLLELQKAVTRAYLVVKNVISQLANLYRSQSKLFNDSFKGVHFQTVFTLIGDLLTSLVTLDAIILSNSSFSNTFTMYRKMIKAIKSDPSRYSVDDAHLVQIDKQLFNLKGALLDGRIFLGCLEQDFDAGGLIDVTGNSEFRKEFFLNIKTIFSSLSAKIGESNEVDQRYRFMGLCALYVFFIVQFKDSSDKKFFKSLWDMHKRVPLLHLHSDVVWFPTDFFLSTIPMMVKNAIPNAINEVRLARKEYLEKVLEKELLMRVQNYYLQVSVWMVRMESNMTNRAEIDSILSTRITFLTQGVSLAYQIGNLFKETVSLYTILGYPLKLSHLPSLCQCIELLKAIQHTYHHRSSLIGESISLLVQREAFRLQQLFLPIRERLTAAKKYSDAKLDVLAATQLAIDMLTGSATKERRLIIKLCTHVVFQMDVFQDQEIEELVKRFQKLEIICDLQESLSSACDASFFYWSRSMLPTYFSNIYDHPQNAYKLSYMFAALRDIIPSIRKAVHEDTKVLIDKYKNEIEEIMKQYILDPLCRDIETDLRLHTHYHLDVQSNRNPLKFGVKDLSKFVKLKPLRLVDKNIDIKAFVTNYLDTTFYNLTTVALHNWKTYGEMRNLAQEKYGLSLTEVHLPGQTLDQGIDVLEIMRNIHIFVSRYKYNLNNQIFVEKTSDNKTLNTINIGHISNSIRTHGIGIMNTTVNFIYQFLRKKFQMFSQFLFDDHIKSRLYRDIKFFKEKKNTINNQYPYDRASKFNKEIRKLGVNDQNLTFLDHFRTLITEIGNAMGFIRMIRSGGFSYISNAIKFIPDLEEIESFEEMVKKENLSQETIEAAHNLDGTVESLYKYFTEGSEYFSLLVDVFAPHFRNEEQLHLKNFYVIIPPLTLNFIEHIITGKEKLSKKKPEGFFSDDGFAMGIAYILKLLDQFKEFDSLHWFDEIATKYLKEQKSLQSQLNDNKQKEDHQTILLNLKKSKMYQMEFELLRYSFDGARVFFKYERDVISKGEGDKARQNEASNSNSTQEEQKPQDPSTNGETTISSMDGFSSAPPPPPPPPPI